MKPEDTIQELAKNFARIFGEDTNYVVMLQRDEKQVVLHNYQDMQVLLETMITAAAAMGANNESPPDATLH